MHMNSLASITLLGEGFMSGLMLTIMMGPVTMIILRYGIQVNRIAGVWAAAGTWISDLIYIFLTYWMTASIDQWSQRPMIRLSLFLMGGLALMVMGLLMLRIKQNPVYGDNQTTSTNYARAFAGGFLVNSLSPFTLFFWLGAAVFLHLQQSNPVWYYLGLMAALAIGDFTKAWIAPKLTGWLNAKHVYWVQMAAGICIAGTGLYVMLMGYFGTT